MTSKKIYLVTSGSYSDYGVDAVFDSEELANKFINSFKNDFIDMRIEEFDLNPHEKEIRKGYSPYFVRMTKDGECTEVYVDTSYYGFGNERTYNFDYNNNMYNYCFAKDEKHAIKITNEVRAQLIAMNQWNVKKLSSMTSKNIKQIQKDLINLNVESKWVFIQYETSTYYMWEFNTNGYMCKLVISEYDMDNNTSKMLEIVLKFFEGCNILLNQNEKA